MIGTSYKIPLETRSDVLVTSHGKRSITGVEIGLSLENATQSQLSAIPGIGEKTAWNLISKRVKSKRKNPDKIAFESIDDAFKSVNCQVPEYAETILKI